MVCCSAFGCSNRSDRKKTSSKPNITFHRFPKDEDLRKKWITAVRRDKWTAADTSVLCSEHFTEDCFDRTSLSVVRLKKNVIPTIFFAFPSYLQQQTIKTRGELKRKLPYCSKEPVDEEYVEQETHNNVEQII